MWIIIIDFLFWIKINCLPPCCLSFNSSRSLSFPFFVSLFLCLSHSISVHLRTEMGAGSCASTRSYLSHVFVSVPPLRVHSLQPNMVGIWVRRLGMVTKWRAEIVGIDLTTFKHENFVTYSSSLVFLEPCIFSQPHTEILGNSDELK